MAVHTVNIDVINKSIPEGNHEMIPVINQPNPCYGYAANAKEVRQLIQLSNYKITEAGTNKPITGNNYYEYFPEEQPGGGGGGGVTSYSSLTEKPAIDNHALMSGNNASSNLGLQTKLTTSQLAAVNSGITDSDVTQIQTNKNNILLKANTSDVNTATANLQAQINNIVTPVTQDAEIQNARVGADGTSYATLKARLDSDFSFLLGDIQAFGISDNILCERIESKGINTVGQIYNNDNTYVYFAPVVPGKIIIAVTNALKYAFYDKKPAFNLISIDSTRHEFTDGEMELSVPLSARYIGIHVNKSATTIPKVYYKGSVQEQAKKANAEIAELKVSPIEGTRITDKTLPIDSLSAASHYPYSNFINKDKFKPDTYVDSDGNIKPTTGFLTTDRIYLNENTAYYMYNLYIGYCAFYASDGTVIAAYGGSSSPFTIYSGPRSIYTFTAPPETSYAIFTVKNVNRVQTAWIYTSDAQPVDFKYYIPIYAEPAYNEPIPTEYKGSETSIFRNVLCIGDSFTQGGFNADAHEPDRGSGFQDYSYPTNLAKMVGFNVTNMGHGGETTVGWNRTYTDTIQGGYDLCIILLGINDCVNYGSFTEQSQEALGEIIAKVKAMNNHIKIFVCTIPLSPSYKTQPIIDSAQIIKDYIESLGDEDVYILDLAEYGHLDDSLAYTYGHPTAYGYHILAEDINNHICYIINKNKMDFKFIQFTGTEYTHNTPR